jgi:hypothetical protein
VSSVRSRLVNTTMVMPISCKAYSVAHIYTAHGHKLRFFEYCNIGCVTPSLHSGQALSAVEGVVEQWGRQWQSVRE